MAHDAHHHHNAPGHHHHHGGDNIKIAFFLNLSFTILEIFGGLWINSVAILSDALHDLGDSLSLGLAWYFEKVAKRDRDKNFTFGYKRFSLLGAVINSMILLVGSVVILFEAVPRLLSPEEVHAPGMIGFALLGIVVNGAAVLRLKGGNSLNEKVVRLHLMEDVLGWVAVMIGGILLYFFDIPIIDPILSISITLFVLYNVFKNLYNGVKIMLQATPANINLDEVKARLETMQEIASIHDLHVWTLDGTVNIFTLHVVGPEDINMNQASALKKKIRSAMADMKISHVTIELEMPGENCSHEGCQETI